MERFPFKDARGDWWIYREDDPNMHTPMGPFLTAGYAKEAETWARRTQAPLPTSLSHLLPVKPLRV